MTMFMVDLGMSSYYSVLGVSPDADVAVIRAAAATIYGDLERARLKTISPEEKRNLEGRKVNINSIRDALSNATQRSLYDRGNAHLTFFQVRKAAAPVWLERGLLLRWMHKAVREFLQEKGETIEPLTDLERSDFTADFTANEWLERLLEEHHDTGGELEQSNQNENATKNN